MNNFLLSTQRWSGGLFVSLVAHILLFVCITPVLMAKRMDYAQSQTFFWGPILTEVDVTGALNPKGEAKRKIFVDTRDLAKETSLGKPTSTVSKPNINLKAFLKKDKVAFSREPSPASLVVRDISFGFSDYADYVSGVDFADLEKMASRDELSRTIDFQVKLTETGEVKWIKKSAGSGDPILDLEVMLKLKKAFFKVPSGAPNSLSIRFKLK